MERNYVDWQELKLCKNCKDCTCNKDIRPEMIEFPFAEHYCIEKDFTLLSNRTALIMEDCKKLKNRNGSCQFPEMDYDGLD